MERRIFLAVLLSFAVVYAFQALFLPPPQPVPETPQELAQPERADRPTTAAPATPSAAAAQARATVSEVAEREIVVDTPTIHAVFTNRGGRLKQWLLKEYKADSAGTPVNLVPTNVPSDLPLPFSLRVDEGGLTPRLNDSLYRATQTGDRLTFEFEDESGLKVRKEFSIDAPKYLITFTAAVQQGDRTFNPLVQWGPGLGDIGATSAGGSYFTGNYVQPPQAIAGVGKDVTRIPAYDLPSSPVQEGTFNFAGVDDHYFLAAVVEPGPVRVEYRDLKLAAINNPEAQRELVAHTFRFPQPPSEKRFFFGPKSFDLLKTVDEDLQWAVHFGVFRVIAVPFLGALQQVHKVIGNYGWAIIVLTILINLALSPLRHWSVLSMRKMQEIQPQVKAIQDRYANLKVTDPARQKMNTEVMNLYREKGVNPAIGCVPMLLTFPVLLAFYSFLSVAIELRGAEFVGWIHDLSQPDPYYVTPLLMAASMFWQQKITPSTADPAQQRVMMFMPILFSVMFISAPSGLVIYWFASNMWAIGQQYFTNWWIGPPVVHTPRPPAERRLKSAGSGKTAGARK
jgi:YidC/Oxa1 family membrane protein insertase